MTSYSQIHGQSHIDKQGHIITLTVEEGGKKLRLLKKLFSAQIVKLRLCFSTLGL